MSKSTAVQRLIFLFLQMTDTRSKKIIFGAILFLMMYGMKKGLSRYKVKTNLLHDDSMNRQKELSFFNLDQRTCEWEVLQEAAKAY